MGIIKEGECVKKVAILLILLLTTPVLALDKWDKTDIALESIVLSLQLIDWRQTIHISDNPTYLYEKNPLLSRHPSNREVNLIFAAAAITQITVAHILPSKWRKIWLSLWCVEHGYNVGNNLNVGIGIGW